MIVLSSVIVVNSLVARGGVGGRASVFLLERLGFPVIFLPTVLLPWHPGHGPGTRVTVAPTLIDDIAREPGGPVAGCFTGYFGDPAQVDAASRLISGLRSGGVRPLVLCDPVMGDSGRFYVAEGIRDGVRALARNADILTPNRFELAFLAGVDFTRLTDNAALVEAARSLGRPEVVVTSAFAGEGETANLLVTREGSELIAHRAVPEAPHGTGDALAALYLGHRLQGAAPRDALVRATGATLRLIEQAGGAPEMPFAVAQDAIFDEPEAMRIVHLDG